MRLASYVGLCALMLACSVAQAATFTVTVPGTACAVQNVSAVTIDSAGLLHYNGGSLIGTCTAGNTPPPCDPTKPPPAGCGPTPPAACVETTKADLGDYTRQCDTNFGNVTYNGNQLPAYGGHLVRYETLWGTFAPAGTVSGNTFKMPVGIKKFISLAVTAVASGSNRFSANISSGLGGIISMSTVEAGPGRFTVDSTICMQKFGGSNSLQLTSNNTPSAQCKMVAGQTYYLNFAPSNADGTPFCTQQDKCNLAYTISKTN